MKENLSILGFLLLAGAAACLAWKYNAPQFDLSATSSPYEDEAAQEPDRPQDNEEPTNSADKSTPRPLDTEEFGRLKNQGLVAADKTMAGQPASLGRGFVEQLRRNWDRLRKDHIRSKPLPD